MFCHSTVRRFPARLVWYHSHHCKSSHSLITQLWCLLRSGLAVSAKKKMKAIITRTWLQRCSVFCHPIRIFLFRLNFCCHVVLLTIFKLRKWRILALSYFDPSHHPVIWALICQTSVGYLIFPFLIPSFLPYNRTTGNIESIWIYSDPRALCFKDNTFLRN